MNFQRNLFLLKILTFALILIWVAGIVSPIFLKRDNLDLYYFLKMFYKPICHQQVEKSFIINSLQFLVCARCTGIYLGIVLSLVIILIGIAIKIKLKYLLSSIIPTVADIVFYQIGVYDYNKIFSLTTGIFFGATILLFIFETIKNYFNKNAYE